MGSRSQLVACAEQPWGVRQRKGAGSSAEFRAQVMLPLLTAL